MNYIKNVGDDQNKFGDTASVFQINLIKDDQVFNFGENQVTVNIANGSGYILSMTPEKFFGNTVLKLDFNKDPLKRLTPDYYRLEVEVLLDDGDVAKFPTNGGMQFNINKSLKDTQGELVPTVTFDTVLDAVDKKIAVYMDTVKVGPAGPIGPTGVVDTAKDYTWTGTNTFTQPIDARIKERGTLYGVVDALSMIKTAGNNSGFWKLSGVTFVGSGQDYNGSIWGTLLVYPWGDGSGASLILNAVSGFSNRPAQLIAGGDGSTTSLTWYKLADNANVVHNTGSETVAGDKTFTGNNNFTQPIVGTFKTRQATFNDFANVATNMIEYAGYWFTKAGQQIANSPFQPTFGIVEVIPGDVKTAGKITFTPYDPNDGFIYYNIVTWQGLGPWKKIAKDDSVLHLTGDETADGNKVFTQPIAARIKERGAFTGTVDVLAMAKEGATNSGIWKLNGVTIAGTGQTAAIWGTLQINPVGDGSGSELIIVASYGISDGTSQLISYGDSTTATLTWRKLADDSTVIHNTGNETASGNKTFTGLTTFTGQTSFWFKQIQWTSGIMQGTWYLQRMGNFVFARFEKSQNTGTGNTSLSLPVGYRPINNWILDAERGQAGINGNGTVYIGTAYNDNTSMTFVYPTNDAWPTA